MLAELQPWCLKATQSPGETDRREAAAELSIHVPLYGTLGNSAVKR